MLIRRGIEVLVLAVALGGCGNKVPESQTAKKIGQQPRQTLDKAQSDVEKAMKKEAGRLPEAEKKE